MQNNLQIQKYFTLTLLLLLVANIISAFTNSVLDDVVWQAEVMWLNMMCNDNVIFVAKALSRLAMQRGRRLFPVYKWSFKCSGCIHGQVCTRNHHVFFLQSIGLEGGTISWAKKYFADFWNCTAWLRNGGTGGTWRRAIQKIICFGTWCRWLP